MGLAGKSDFASDKYLAQVRTPISIPGTRQLNFKSVSEMTRLTLVAGLSMSKIAYSGLVRKECAAERNELEDVRPRNVLPQNAKVCGSPSEYAEEHRVEPVGSISAGPAPNQAVAKIGDHGSINTCFS